MCKLCLKLVAKQQGRTFIDYSSLFEILKFLALPQGASIQQAGDVEFDVIAGRRENNASWWSHHDRHTLLVHGIGIKHESTYYVRYGERNTWPQRAIWLPTVQHLSIKRMNIIKWVCYFSQCCSTVVCLWLVRYSLFIIYCCQYIICRPILFRITVHFTRVTCFIWLRFYRKSILDSEGFRLWGVNTDMFCKKCWSSQ